MEKLDIRKLKSTLNKGGNYRTLAIAFLIMMIFFPLEGNFKYKYKVGSPWNYETLEAPFDFPILKSESELQREHNQLSQVVVPYYQVDNMQLDNALKFLTNNYNEIDHDSFSTLSTLIKSIYSKGIKGEQSQLGGANSNSLYLNNNGETEQKLWSDLFTPEMAREYLRESLISGNYSFPSNFPIAEIVEKLPFTPNLHFDKSSTDKIHRAALDEISPTKGIIYTGEFIVAEGEIVTENVAQILDSYKSEYKKSVGYEGSVGSIYLGHILLILALFLLIYIAIYFSDYQILRKQNEFNFIITILVLNFVVAALARKFLPDYLYIIPMAVTSIYLYAFVLNRVVLPIYFISLLPLLLIMDNGEELFLIQAVAGAVAFITFSLNDRGWQQFLNALYILIAMVLVHVAYTLSVTGSYDFTLHGKVIIHLFINAILVVLFYHLVVILEKLFNMVATTSYRDWSDTDNRLLRMLQQKAPGTFQHVLQVASMSERAIIAIGGNSKMVRAGALYHDIGKILNPQAFTENQDQGRNYHQGLTPKESASIIIKHVEDGLDLAKKYKLPQELTNFIRSHHGTSMTEYFYNTYCNNGGDPNDKEPFTYKGELPSTKEEAVVMIADAVEAASRSLKEYSEESISNLVDSVVYKRVTGNMLERADISLKEINTVKKVLKKILSEIYHARIAYPNIKR